MTQLTQSEKSCVARIGIVNAVRAQLSWMHIRTLIGIEDKLNRKFYTAKDLESAIIVELQKFSIVLGSDFAFMLFFLDFYRAIPVLNSISI